MSFVAADVFGSGGPDYAGIASKQEAQRQAAITQGTQAIDQAYAGFDQGFYNNRAQAYQDFATPQLGQQYTNAKDDISFGLANRNLTGGSSATKQFGDLNNAMIQGQQQIVDTGRSQAQSLENQVNASKDQQLALLYQSADPAGAAAGAVSTAASLAQPTAFAPVANMFSNLINQYYTSQIIDNYKPTSYVTPPTDYSTGIGDPNKPQ